MIVLNKILFLASFLLILSFYYCYSHEGYIIEKNLYTATRLALYTNDHDDEMGFVTYRGPDADTPCYLVYLKVDEKYQHNTIGSQLYRYALQSMKEMGCSCVTFDALPESVGFYLKHGAKIMDKKQEPDMDHTVPMCHELE